MARSKTSAGDWLFQKGTGLFALVIVLIAVAIAVVLWERSLPSIEKFGLAFWSADLWDPVAGNFGARPFIWGTLYSSFIALLMAAPLALGIAIFLSELCPHRLRQPLVFLTELLAAIPSIVYGLWGIFVLVPGIRTFESALPEWLRATPFFHGPPLGVGMFSAAVVLAIMIVPFSSAVAREVLKAVPAAQREGAYALGATRWEATKVALYYTRVGIVGAIMLGLGRALGETMAVTMVIGNTPQVSLSLMAPQYTMAAVMANEFPEATSTLHISALVEIGLVLFVVTLGVNMLSRLLIWNMTRRRVERVIVAPLVPEEKSA
jgi:phosphate transport system permease protein